MFQKVDNVTDKKSLICNKLIGFNVCVVSIYIFFINTVVCFGFYFVFETGTHYVAPTGPEFC